MNHVILFCMTLVFATGCKKAHMASESKSENTETKTEENMTPKEFAALYHLNKKSVVSKVFAQLESCKALEKACNYHTETFKTKRQRIIELYKRKAKELSARNPLPEVRESLMQKLKADTKAELAAAEAEFKSANAGTTAAILEYIRSLGVYKSLTDLNRIHDLTPDVIERSVIGSKLDKFFMPTLDGLGEAEIADLGESGQRKIDRIMETQ